ncbi:type II toxin-antitoxin system VapC family toxin [Anabaena sp. AL93]|uniref:type II toxin-antitoxin system VapC family toxin n=1 Tax=Anabaena sp. AL93 TaxID=1678133 RepID=UPI0007FE6DCE|nr:type II toxin-antitoxin system VapC family toxin [Anabaena sp. AL93]OBQ20270.1 MAG: twitching motility protein PilT [Anabaena sp. AL93]
MILVDTYILIDVSRNIDIAINRLDLEEKTNQISISVITEMELIVGCRNKLELQHINKFLSRYDISQINDNISIFTVELIKTYRLSHGLLMPDAFIAATSIINNFPLLTKNQSDYRFISGINLLPYP